MDLKDMDKKKKKTMMKMKMNKFLSCLSIQVYTNDSYSCSQRTPLITEISGSH